eukprot:7333050-Heterocapsa_arctica.AAC.1
MRVEDQADLQAPKPLARLVGALTTDDEWAALVRGEEVERHEQRPPWHMTEAEIAVVERDI